MIATDVGRRVLGVDVRPRRFGHVCLERRNRLLACGAARFTSLRAAEERLANLLDELAPQVLVLRRVAPGSRRDQPKTRAIQHLLREMARQNQIEVVAITERQLSDYFRLHDRRNKHERASLLAQLISELAWYQPGRRKAWQSEHQRMLIFDAAALAVVYFWRTSA